jgi:Flp pilus assembly protein TadG
MFAFVIACVGLAVDVGTIYMIKARLSSAVDAAALAAGRSVNLANSLQAAQSAAVTTADNFFAANFPTYTDPNTHQTVGYFNTIGAPSVTPSLTQETDSNGNPNGVLDIAVTASVTAPTYFMNIFLVHSLTVAATGTSSRRGLVLMLVLDTSSSMGTGNPPPAGSPCAEMVTAAQNFVNMFSPFDQIGLVIFDYTAHLKDAPTTSRAQVISDIQGIRCNNNTNTISALELAYQQIQAANLPLALNSIVLFTDGSPNGVSANFPARTQLDDRWGPAINDAGPSQAGLMNYGQTNSCSDVGPTDPNQALTTDTPPATVNEEAICHNMPVAGGCTNAGDTLHGTLVQWGDQSSWGGTTSGLYPPTDTDAVSYSGSCNPGGSTTNIRQYIAYIPQYDIYGNDLWNACGSSASCPTATGTSSYGTVVNNYDTRRSWLFQMNWTGSNSFTFTPNHRNEGGTWVNNGATGGVGSGSNFFPAGSAYQLQLRPDQPNSVVAASMNGAMSEAFRIRSDAETVGTTGTKYRTFINTIYLVGNATDAVDREFLAIVANAKQITALPYDTSFTPYNNPVYQTDQETGQYLVTSDKTQLNALFTQLASEVLRLSH